MKYLLAILVQIVFLNCSLAASEKTVIYFVNGIGVTEDAAVKSLRNIKYRYTSKYILSDIFGDEYEFANAYNNSRGLRDDIVEVINQKNFETGGLTVEELIKYAKYSKSVAKAAIKKLSTATGGGRIVIEAALRALDNYAEIHLEAMKKYNSSQVFIDINETLSEMVNLYLGSLREGNRVILIAHSQGNLFADRALTEVKRIHPEYSNSIGIVSVATPASGLPHGNEYITAHDDFIIESLGAVNDALPSNFDNRSSLVNLFDGRDPSNHFFLASYFSGKLKSRPAIDGMVVTQRSRLSLPPAPDDPVTTAQDSDLDGLENDWEISNGLNPNSPDSDNDSLDDLTEVGDVNSPIDVDSDGLIDALNPCLPSVSNNACRSNGLVLDVNPKRTFSGSSEEFTVIGSNLPDNTDVRLEDSSCVHQGDRSPLQQRFLCQVAETQKNNLTLAVGWSSGEQLATYQIEIERETVISTPEVTNVDPPQAILGVLVNFVITGESLPDTIAISLQGTNNCSITSRTSSQVIVQCIPQESGVRDLYVADRPGGEPIQGTPWSITITEQVVASPRVIDLNPRRVTPNTTEEFTVIGDNLNEDIVLELEDSGRCQHQGSRDTQRQRFLCNVADTQKTTLTALVGIAFGDQLASYPIVVDQPQQTAVISSVSPNEATVGQVVTFTLKGSNLPTPLAVSLEGTANCQVITSSSTQASVRCTPQTSGAQSLFVASESGGSAISGTPLSIDVSPPPLAAPVINGVNPDAATVGEEVDFTLTGSNLPNTLVVSLEGTANCWLVSNSATQAVVRCAPQTAGKQSLFVASESGGLAISGTPLSIDVSPVLVDNIPVPEMVNIPAGCFDMGSPDDEPERDTNEGPQFNVCISAFRMGRYEVTFEQYDAYASATGNALPEDDVDGWGRGNRPVINVQPIEAEAYAAWLATVTGQQYRLPTEAEWEYAARAGTNTPFHTGQTITTDQANFDGRSTYNGSATGILRLQTVPVGSLNTPNAFGLHDMHGNVGEFTCSSYGGEGSFTGTEQFCATDNSGLRRWRGGSWAQPPVRARSADRSSGGIYYDRHGSILNAIGFRLVQD